MNRLAQKAHALKMRKHRIRATVSGTPERPRLTVHISNKHIAAQVIDDTTHHTVAAISTVGQKDLKGSKTALAEWVGTEIAKKSKSAKVTKVVLDRNGKLYHGRIQALAEAARKAGLEF
jgi:large subunit ribosomal protein L18